MNTIYTDILDQGLPMPNVDQQSFKDYSNIYFRKIQKHFIRNWESEYQKLTLKFDDRLNKFFLYKDYNPVVGFYLYQNSLQIIPFYNRALNQAIAQLIDFQTKINKNTQERQQQNEATQ